MLQQKKLLTFCIIVGRFLALSPPLCCPCRCWLSMASICYSYCYNSSASYSAYVMPKPWCCPICAPATPIPSGPPLPIYDYLLYSILIYSSMRSCSSNCYARFSSFSCILAAIIMSWSLGSIFLMCSDILLTSSFYCEPAWLIIRIYRCSAAWLAWGLLSMPTKLLRYIASSGYSYRWFSAEERCSGSTPPLSTVSISKSLLRFTY